MLTMALPRGHLLPNDLKKKKENTSILFFFHTHDRTPHPSGDKKDAVDWSSPARLFRHNACITWLLRWGKRRRSWRSKEPRFINVTIQRLGRNISVLQAYIITARAGERGIQKAGEGEQRQTDSTRWIMLGKLGSIKFVISDPPGEVTAEDSLQRSHFLFPISLCSLLAGHLQSFSAGLSCHPSGIMITTLTMNSGMERAETHAGEGETFFCTWLNSWNSYKWENGLLNSLWYYLYSFYQETSQNPQPEPLRTKHRRKKQAFWHIETFYWSFIGRLQQPFFTLWPQWFSW